jgi:hypothetical protein
MFFHAGCFSKREWYVYLRKGWGIEITLKPGLWAVIYFGAILAIITKTWRHP